MNEKSEEELVELTKKLVAMTVEWRLTCLYIATLLTLWFVFKVVGVI